MTKHHGIGLLAGFAIACSTASSVQGPTQSEFDTLKAEVEAQAAAIATLQADLAAIEPAAFGSSVFVNDDGGSATLAFRKLAATDQVVGTYVGTDSNRLSAATAMHLTSPLGFYFELPTDGGTAGPAPMPLGDVLYEGPGCTGNGYLRQGTAISPYGVRQGAVTRIGTDVTLAASYAMVVPGTPQTMVNAQSRLTQPGVCEDIVFTQLGFLLVPNDVAVSGVESAPLAADVVVGPGG